MRVPRQHGIADLLANFQQRYGEGNRGERMPEFRHFVVDERSDQRRARKSKHPAEESLISVFICCRPLRGQIEGRSNAGQRDPARRNVSVLQSFAVEVDHGDAIQGQQAKDSVLYLRWKDFSFCPSTARVSMMLAKARAVQSPENNAQAADAAANAPT